MLNVQVRVPRRLPLCARTRWPTAPPTTSLRAPTRSTEAGPSPSAGGSAESAHVRTGCSRPNKIAQAIMLTCLQCRANRWGFADVIVDVVLFCFVYSFCFVLFLCICSCVLLFFRGGGGGGGVGCKLENLLELLCLHFISYSFSQFLCVFKM